MVVGLTVLLSSANLICRGTDISKCFIESDFEITRVDCIFLTHVRNEHYGYALTDGVNNFAHYPYYSSTGENVTSNDRVAT